jgi:indolepyruvate ferredoxin oxidoreductase beta subunit
MTARPITVLIAALGGEGGGVLTDWLVAAAMRADLPVQSTSIPGVAQRTGATTYYVEIFPEPNASLGGRRPLMGLYPSPGGVDLMLASEIVEAGRALENGFVTPDRTVLATATHRIYAVVEKQVMTDGRFDTTRILRAARELSRRSILFDLTRSRKTGEFSLNAVLFGIAAGSGVLPIAREIFEAAIRETGVAVEANLRAFDAGFSYGASGPPAEILPQDEVAAIPASPASPTAMLAAIARDFPAGSIKLVEEGVRRLIDYQDQAYAQLYLERLRRIVAVDRTDGVLTAAVARHLALWMSYEDVIRVADLKTRPDRFAKVREEVGAKPDEPVHVTDIFKPGVDEVSALLPPGLGRRLRDWADRPGAYRRLHFSMRARSTSVTGFLRLWLLARLRPWRRRSFRFAEEQEAMAAWLAAIERVALSAPDFAREIVECARLLKGYSDTHRRGRENYQRIFNAVIRPRLERPTGAAAALRRAREAAFADPEGAALSRELAAIATAPAGPTSAAAE